MNLKTIVLAILAVALVTLPAPALGADDSDDDAATKTDIDELATEIKGLATLLRALQTTVEGLVSTAATINTNVSNHGQIAVVMTRPHATHPESYNANTHLLGSSIPGFPAGTVGTDGLFTNRILPAGTYLFELQKPSYGDNMVCHGSVSQYFAAGRFRAACPYVWLNVQRGDDRSTKQRLDDGFRVVTSDGTARFWVRHGFPTGWSFDDKPARQYTGAVKITRLK